MAVRQRILSLDVLRGITVAAMILVNNPAVWGNAYVPLQHAFWHGLTPTDFIYPFFVFIMGVSAYFSLYRRSMEDRKAAIWHVTKRSALIFLTGMALNAVSALAYGRLTSWEGFRIMGVLQGLALAYFISAMLMILFRFRKLTLTMVILLAVYWVILLAGNGFDLSPDNIIAVVDRAVMGAGHLYVEHLPDGTSVGFEPEGFLSTIPRVAQVLAGAVVGRILYDSGKDSTEKLNGILLFGAVMVIAGFLIQYGCPFNKKIWSPSFALVTSGAAALMTGLLYKAIDIDGRKKWTSCFRVFGVNPLFLYVLAWVFSVFVNMDLGAGQWHSLKNWFYGNCIAPFFADAFGSLVYSLVFVMVIWSAGYILDRHKIYIKL